MTARRLLYLNIHHLSAYVWQHDQLLPEGVFEPDDDGLEAFAQYLRQQHKSQFSVLANVAEEGHIVETIPFLQGSDRKALITRKIGQHFLGTPLAIAISLGYEKAKRKNEKLLISALTNPASFEPWLQRINDAGAPLAGVYTLAQLGGLLLKKLGHAPKRCLLLTQQELSIRESYLVDGQTLFSRMAPVHDSSIAGIASSLTAEAGKLHQYLVGQRLASQDENLPTFIIAHPQVIPAIEISSPEHARLDFILIDSRAAAKKIKLANLPEDRHSEFLFLHLLATATPRQQFADETYRHDFRLAQIRQGIIATGLVALLGSALFSAKEIYQAYNLRQESQALLSSEADLDWRYREISTTFPQLGIDNDTLRRLTAHHADLNRQQRQPGPAYRSVSRALGQMPDIVLDGIEWKIGRSGPSTVANMKSFLGTAVIAGDEEITLVRGNIQRQSNASTRQILQTFEQFVDILRSDPAQTVNILQQPFEMESGRTLRGGDNEDDSAPRRPFALEISRKIAP